MNCPNCLAELPTNVNYIFACPNCKFLLLKHENKIKQVDELDIIKKIQQVSKFQRWICSTIRKHEWSDEGYVTAIYEGGCTKYRVCMRCFERAIKVEKHEFIPKYLHEDSCEVLYICKKCGAQNTEKWTSDIKSHSFGEWVSDNKVPWTKTRKCKRCGKQEIQAYIEDTWRQD